MFLNTFLNYLNEKSIVYYKEFDELVKNILTVNFSTDKNYTKYTNYTDSNFSLNDYLINNILDGFNKQNKQAQQVRKGAFNI